VRPVDLHPVAHVEERYVDLGDLALPVHHGHGPRWHIGDPGAQQTPAEPLVARVVQLAGERMVRPAQQRSAGEARPRVELGCHLGQPAVTEPDGVSGGAAGVRERGVAAVLGQGPGRQGDGQLRLRPPHRADRRQILGVVHADPLPRHPPAVARPQHVDGVGLVAEDPQGEQPGPRRQQRGRSKVLGGQPAAQLVGQRGVGRHPQGRQVRGPADRLQVAVQRAAADAVPAHRIARVDEAVAGGGAVDLGESSHGPTIAEATSPAPRSAPAPVDERRAAAGYRSVDLGSDPPVGIRSRSTAR
jgi:hypothetical protein